MTDNDYLSAWPGDILYPKNSSGLLYLRYADPKIPADVICELSDMTRCMLIHKDHEHRQWMLVIAIGRVGWVMKNDVRCIERQPFWREPS